MEKDNPRDSSSKKPNAVAGDYDESFGFKEFDAT
jgi:hypothetical protein